MKTFLLSVAAVACVASVAVASPDDKKSVKCAVMTGNNVDIKDATAKKMYADYKGNRYFFCCGGCPGAFNKDPAKYAKNDHIKTPKDAKKKA